MSVSVLSTTGRRVNLKDKSDNELAAMLDALEDEQRQVKEQIKFVTRELAKRMDGKSTLNTEGFTVFLQTYANVSRRVTGRLEARSDESRKRGLLSPTAEGVVQHEAGGEA